MKQTVAEELKKKAKEIAERYSNPERGFNHNKELFSIDKIIPLSEYTAAVIYLKDSDKKACFFFYYIQTSTGNHWNYYVPTDSHILGMGLFSQIKQKIEEHNFI